MFRLCIIIIILIARYPSFTMTPDNLIAKNTDAIGGADKLKNLRTLSFESEITSDKIHMLMKVYIKFPSRIRAEITTKDTKIVTVFDGENGWVANKSSATHIPRKKFQVLKAQLLSQIGYYIYTLYWLNENKASISSKGKEKINNTEYYRLNVNYSGKEQNVYYINPKTFLVDRIIMVKDYLGRDLNTLVILKGYRKTDGINFPSKADVFSGINKLSDIDYTDIKINKKLNGIIFDFPKK